MARLRRLGLWVVSLLTSRLWFFVLLGSVLRWCLMSRVLVR